MVNKCVGSGAVLSWARLAGKAFKTRATRQIMARFFSFKMEWRKLAIIFLVAV
jgi:hypothetical protein